MGCFAHYMWEIRRGFPIEYRKTIEVEQLLSSPKRP